MGNPSRFHSPPGRFARSVQFLRVGSSESAWDGCRTKGKGGRRTVWSSSCWDGTTFCLWRASIRPLLCQTMTYPYGEPTNPSGSAIPPPEARCPERGKQGVVYGRG